MSISPKKLTHNKLKNTGLIFEILTRQLALDAMNKKQYSQARDLLMNFFSENSEIHKEFEIYNTIMQLKTKDKNYAKEVIKESLQYIKQINLPKLKKEKYELIKKISENYNIEELFKNVIHNYRTYASIYKLIKLNEEKNIITKCGEVSILIENIVNYIVKRNPSKFYDDIKVPDDDKYVLDRLTYKIMVNKFNNKYKTLNDNQKKIIKLYSENSTNAKILKEELKNTVNNAKKYILDNINKIDDKVLKIKLNYLIKEVDKVNKNINSGKVIKENTISTVMLYDELANSIKEL